MLTSLVHDKTVCLMVGFFYIIEEIDAFNKDTRIYLFMKQSLSYKGRRGLCV